MQSLNHGSRETAKSLCLYPPHRHAVSNKVAYIIYGAILVHNVYKCKQLLIAFTIDVFWCR